MGIIIEKNLNILSRFQTTIGVIHTVVVVVRSWHDNTLHRFRFHRGHSPEFRNTPPTRPRQATIDIVITVVQQQFTLVAFVPINRGETSDTDICTR